MAGLDAIFGFFVARPRPNPLLIHVHMPETVSSLVLERISQGVWTSDKLSKELSPGLFT